MIAPDSASSPPIMPATAMRGIRIVHSTSSSRASMEGSAFAMLSPSAAARRGSGMPAAPTVVASSATVKTPCDQDDVNKKCRRPHGHTPRERMWRSRRASAAITYGSPRKAPPASRPQLFGPGRDRATGQGRGLRRRCVGRSPRDTARPSRRMTFSQRPAVSAKDGLANTVAASSCSRPALHGQHHVGLRRDDRLVIDRLVAVETFHGVDAAGHLDDFVRRRPSGLRPWRGR